LTNQFSRAGDGDDVPADGAKRKALGRADAGAFVE
jgi:hypothetical protein